MTPNDEATRSHGMAGSPQPRATDRETGVVQEGCELRMDTPALGTSCERQSRQLSCAQSFALIARDNQAEEEVSFQAWTVEAGSWGGRVPDTMEAAGPVKEQCSATTQAVSLKEWVESSER